MIPKRHLIYFLDTISDFFQQSYDAGIFIISCFVLKKTKELRNQMI